MSTLYKDDPFLQAAELLGISLVEIFRHPASKNIATVDSFKTTLVFHSSEGNNRLIRLESASQKPPITFIARGNAASDGSMVGRNIGYPIRMPEGEDVSNATINAHFARVVSTISGVTGVRSELILSAMDGVNDRARHRDRHPSQTDIADAFGHRHEVYAALRR